MFAEKLIFCQALICGLKLKLKGIKTSVFICCIYHRPINFNSFKLIGLWYLRCFRNLVFYNLCLIDEIANL